MYTAGLAPFYASNFSLWSAAYCAPAGPAAGGCFPLDPAGLKKPSFCIADILHAAAGEVVGDGLAGGSSLSLAAHIGSVHAHAQFHAAGSPLRPTPVVASDAAVTFPARLSAAYSHSPHHRSPTGTSPVPGRGQNHQTHLGSAPAPSSKDLKFGIDRILSAEFDPKVKESNTLRDLTSLLASSRQTGVHVPSLQSSAGQFFASLEPLNEVSGVLGPLNTTPRSSVQHQFQDTFPGPYAVLTKDTLPQTYKRKRSWSRAVFSNLQRKGLEKRFEIQKYVTKPDRKQLAAMLGLTDAQECSEPVCYLLPKSSEYSQNGRRNHNESGTFESGQISDKSILSKVKVWFQNRRMKWRHSKEAQAQKDKEKEPAEKAAGGAAPAGEGEPESSPSRSEGESESSEAESLELEPGSDAERTEAGAAADQALQHRHATAASLPLQLPAECETAVRPELLSAPARLDPSREALRRPEPPFGLRESP